jgi:hypothetical protein
VSPAPSCLVLGAFSCLFAVSFAWPCTSCFAFALLCPVGTCTSGVKKIVGGLRKAEVHISYSMGQCCKHAAMGAKRMIWRQAL